MDAPRRLGIDGLQLRVQRRPSEPRGTRVDSGSQLRIGGGQRGQASDQRIEVEHRAAHQHGQRTTTPNRVDGSERIGDKITRAVALVGFTQIEQVVRNSRTQRRARLG